MSSNYDYVNRYQDMVYDAAGLRSSNFGEPNMEKNSKVIIALIPKGCQVKWIGGLLQTLSQDLW